MLRLTFVLLLAAPSPAFAMNWEGHADWTDSFVPGMEFMDAAPEARPLPDKPCPVTREQLAANPYEQIPLPRHNCKPPAKNESRK